MSGPIDAGDVEIVGNKIMLYTFNKGNELNIYPQVKGFDIYESLDNYTLTADFYIAEGIDLVNKFPLGGEEFIEISFRTPSRETVSYTFFVESVQGMKTNDQANMRSYMLRCCTKDFLLNSTTVFSKRYKDRKYDDALTELLEIDMGAGTSLITRESTKGKFDYVVNNMRPFQIINLIKERAVSKDFKSSFFVFYEDNKGYHFQTVEKLIKERKGGAKGKSFSYDTANRAEDTGKSINVRNILAYETVSQGSAIKKVTAGAIRNQVREFDLHRGTYYKKNEYVNISDHGQYEKTADEETFDFNSADYNNFASKLPGSSRMSIKDATRPEMEHNNNIHLQRPFRERMFQYGLRIRVYGDTSIRVGDIIELKFPEIAGLTDGLGKQGEVFSGNYIVTNLKHRCDQRMNNKFEHFMVMDVAKPNQFGKSLG
jgi:hypothetical protein